MSVELRPIAREDDPFLRRLYASTRSRELADAPWTPEQKQTFVTQQFDAQHRHYRETFENADFDVVERDGAPIGRLYVDRRADEIRVIDIALVPESRNQGLGAKLMQSLLDEAKESGKRVSIHVELGSPARRFYERLGFATVCDDGMHTFMEWSPAGE